MSAIGSSGSEHAAPGGSTFSTRVEWPGEECDAVCCPRSRPGPGLPLPEPRLPVKPLHKNHLEIIVALRCGLTLTLLVSPRVFLSLKESLSSACELLWVIHRWKSWQCDRLFRNRCSFDIFSFVCGLSAVLRFTLKHTVEKMCVVESCSPELKIDVTEE